jgi:transcriptional regulator with XRE-family HTH domain
MAISDYGESRLPELLKLRHMSQAEFARKLGVTEGFVSQLISGKSKFSLLTAKMAADILKCHVEDLYEWIKD